MAGKEKQVTSLWSLIERMQQRLESEGLDLEAVDAAVARGLEALLDIAPPVRPRSAKRATPRLLLWTGVTGARTPAKA